MSFNVQRSNRQTEFWKDPTPKVVAPGTYDPRFDKNLGGAMGQGATAPFNTIKERDTHDKVKDNPGPGFYKTDAKQQDNRVSSANPNNAFATKVSRFAPTAPGSTVFKTATSFFNPGPGTYFKQVEWDKKPVLLEAQEKYKKKQHKSMVAPPKANPPSIPLKKVPQNSHTGRGKDIPGPANYDPRDQVIKKANRLTDFAKAGKVKSAFDVKSTDEPGPGMYDDRKDLATHTTTGFNASENLMFLSRVPNWKDTKDDNGIPGPGSYFKLKKKKALHQRSHSYRVDPNGHGFNTTTKREGFWDNKLEAPFTKGTNITEGPGPDKYQADNKKLKNAAKTSDMGNAKPAFNCSDVRTWMRKSGKAQSPGPGQYIDINGSMFISSAGMAKYNSERGLGGKPGTANITHFGSKSLRFERGMFNPKEGPGPGQYNNEAKSEHIELQGILTKAQIDGKGKAGAVFRSTTDRFVENAPNNPSIRILDKKPNYRNDLAIYNIKQQPQEKRIGYSTNYRPGRHVGFTATSPRFAHNQLFYGQKLKYTPGPGDYTYVENRPKTYSQARSKGRKQLGIFNSSEMKFNRGNNSYIGSKCTNQNIGPGSYISTECTMIKKSYNMSME